jgi:phosphatidate cytidylyltransferase
VLRHRLIFGPILIAALVLVAWLDHTLEGRPLPALFGSILNEPSPAIPPGVVIFFAMVVASVMASRELAAILRAEGIQASKRIMTTASIAGLLVSCLVPARWEATTSVAVSSSAAVGVLLLSLLFYSRKRTVEGAVAAAGGTLLSFVYLGLMFGFVLAIRREHSVWILVWIILTTKASDIGAFATGKAIGRHKLILWLSPGKTWEGLFGGLALSAIVGAAGLWALHALKAEAVPPIWTGAVAGLIFGATGVVGDLIASLFKRDAGLKDSSHVLPGFGGVIDVLDSALLVAPVAFWWVRLIHTP